MSAEENTATPTETPAPEDKQPTSKELDALKAEAAEKDAKLKALQDKERDRAAKKKQKDDEAARQKAIEDGRAAEEIKALQERIAKQEAQLKAIENRRLAATESKLKSIEDESVRAGIAKWKDKMSADDFADFVDEQINSLMPSANNDEPQPQPTTPAANPPPPVQTGGNRLVKKGRQLTPEAYEILDMMGVPAHPGERLEVTPRGMTKQLNTFIRELKMSRRPDRYGDPDYSKSM